MPDETVPQPVAPLPVITVWPCTHGNVLVEPGRVPRHTRCHQCGSVPATYVLEQSGEGGSL